MLMTSHKTRDFLIDRRNGVRFQELMRKYNLSEEMLDQIFGTLRRSDMLALRRLWEQDKLSDTQFMRAFEEVEDDL
jgi:Mor family transcriptional regulator